MNCAPRLRTWASTSARTAIVVLPRVGPRVVAVGLRVKHDANTTADLRGLRAQPQVCRDALPLPIIEPIHLPIVRRVKAKEVVGERLPLDGGEVVELRFELRLVPGRGSKAWFNSRSLKMMPSKGFFSMLRMSFRT